MHRAATAPATAPAWPLAAALLLAGCLGAAPPPADPGPGPAPGTPEAPAIGSLDAGWMEANLPAAPVPFAALEERTRALAASPRATLVEEGRSGLGLPLWTVALAEGGTADKPTVLVTGSQHGDEPSGSDAAILLATWLAFGGEDAAQALRALNVVVLVCANPDGREAGERGNATGEDVNRDHMDLASPEARAIHAAYHRADPAVVLDLHQFGAPPLDPPPTPASAAIVFEVGAVQNPLAHAGIVAESQTLAGQVALAVQAAFGPGAASVYPPTGSSQDSSIHRNHYGMHNSVSLLFEARRGLDRYEDEVLLQVVGLREVLAQVGSDPAGFRSAKADAEAEHATLALPLRAYLTPPQDRQEDLAALLALHGLAANLTEGALAATGVHYGISAEPARTSFPAGTLVAPLAQPDWRALAETFESSSLKDPNYAGGPRDLGLDVWREAGAPT